MKKEHLEKMSEITRNLSYNDINLLKHTNKRRRAEVGKDEIQKEIQE